MHHHPETIFSKDIRNSPWSQIIFSRLPFPLTSQQHSTRLIYVSSAPPGSNLKSCFAIFSLKTTLTASSFSAVPLIPNLFPPFLITVAQHLLRPLLCDRHWAYFLTADCIFSSAYHWFTVKQIHSFWPHCQFSSWLRSFCRWYFDAPKLETLISPPFTSASLLSSIVS